MSKVLPDWNNLAVLERNRLKPRSFFVPYSSEEENKGNIAEPSASSMCLSLNGAWEFRYYSDSAKIPEIFAEIDSWDKVTVPHMWQLDGNYEKPLYTNIRYPFPQTPPLVPSINPAGVYRRYFEIGSIEGDIIISLLGVASAYHLYINGQNIGYSEVSHMTGEFDITPYVKTGSNEIIIIVYKWCNGSYLEDQDMFRHNGIFRDVYITLNPKAYIYDSVLRTQQVDGGYKLNIVNTLKGEHSSCVIEYRLERSDKIVSMATTQASDCCDIEMFVKNPDLWSAEIPNCYTLWITLKDSDNKELVSITHTVGFKTVEIKGRVFYFNGKAIKLKGVNKHDTSPDRGYAVSREYERSELENMKVHNVNCIRFSHYPPSPYVLEMCDQMGFYVVDEADIESHGGGMVEDWSHYYADRPEWYDSFFDRISRMYYRDRNHACITMWSLGNESGFGQNHIKCAEWLKTVTDIPVHYERARLWEEGGCGFSVVSHMYTSPEEIRQYVEDKTFDRPYYLCEYAHAMGVGPGGLKEYWDVIFEHECLMGGCIWEWRDHAIFHPDGPYKYTYGGNHGEYVHDGNFCVDGMIFPDGSSSPAALEVKNVYRPVISKYNGNQVVLKNMQYFATANFVTEIELLKDGKSCASQKIKLNIPAQEEWLLTTDLISRAVGEGEYLLNLTYYKEDGRICGTEQHAITQFRPINYCISGKVNVKEDRSSYRVFADNVEYVFDKSHANLQDIIIDGKNIFNNHPIGDGYNYYSGAVHGFVPEIMRYCIDNDRYIKVEWEKKFYNLMWLSVLDIEATQNNDSFVLKSRLSYSPPVFDPYFEVEIIYTVNGVGELLINTSLIPLKDNLPWLPKFGLKAELNRGFDTLNWYGYGPEENFCDFVEAARLGEYSYLIKELCPNYIRPQEGGNRGGIRRAELINSLDRIKLDVIANDKPLNMNARHFDAKKYIEWAHPEDIQDCQTTQVCIDGFYSGIGSNSCGPQPQEYYRVSAGKRLDFAFIIKPELI